MFTPVLLQAVHLGYFATEDSAAQMYDRAAVCVWGPEAILNFPRRFYDSDELPDGWVSDEEQLHSVLRKFKVQRKPQHCTQVLCPPGLHWLACDLLLMCQHAAQAVCVRLLDRMLASLLAHMPACLQCTMQARLNMIRSVKYCKHKFVCRLMEGCTPLPSHMYTSLV